MSSTARAPVAGSSPTRAPRPSTVSGTVALPARSRTSLTEEITLLPGGVSDVVYDEAARHFGEEELAHLIALVFTVNTWNRMNVTTRKTPGTE